MTQVRDSKSEHLSDAQKATLEVVKKVLTRGEAPSGYPAVQPCWRVVGDVEMDEDTEESSAVRRVLSDLRRGDSQAYDVLARAAAGHALDSSELMQLVLALDEVDGAVERLLSDA